MRRPAITLLLSLFLTACAGQVITGTGAQTDDTASPTSVMDTPIAPTTTLSPTPGESHRQIQMLTTDNLRDGASLIARAGDPVEVYDAPGAIEATSVLEATTILGTPTVLAVLDGPEDGWALVQLPGRPNGATGWIEVEEMSLYLVDDRLVVDLSDRILTYYESGSEVLSTSVAVGSPRNPTPTGEFFVTDNVTLADPNSPWGPHALGLSARSETITEYNGGDGIIGIHGTNVPGSIGNAASLGCVRVPNEIIARLHELIAIGTPVTINA